MIEYQRIILADPVRNEAFARALQQVIRPGMTLTDIGSGTGFLSFLASRLGAKECRLYEQSELLSLSRELAAENGITNLRFTHKHSTEIRDPPKSDIVIAEVLGNFALEEGIVETMNDARRFLKPKGILIPQSLTQFVAPVTSDRLWKEVTSWDRIGHDLSYGAARERSINNVYVRTVRTEELWQESDAVRAWDQLDFHATEHPVRHAEVSWPIDHAVTVYGFCVWWEATLIPGVFLGTGPTDPPTHWGQIYLPVREPVILKSGATLSLTLDVDSRHAVRINIVWEVRAAARGGAVHTSQKMDMREGTVD